ncbi:MAG: shikimate kinase [Clostridiaceae bacterium]
MGMPGCGKTTLGKKLSKITGYDFIDTDLLIEKRIGLPIKKIFNKKGEKYFRILERDLLCEIKNYKNHIISTGGGFPIYNDNMEVLNNLGLTVFLNVPIEELMKRNLTKRPLLVEDVEEKLKELYKIRSPIYNKAKLTVDNYNISLDEVAKSIIDKMK